MLTPQLDGVCRSVVQNCTPFCCAATATLDVDCRAESCGDCFGCACIQAIQSLLIGPLPRHGSLGVQHRAVARHQVSPRLIRATQDSVIGDASM